MKFKNILLAALVAGAGTAVAQNTANVTQTGSFSTGNISQTGMGHQASITTNSNATASSDANKATITQTSTGIGDMATIKQGLVPTFGVKKTEASILQEGNNNLFGKNVALIQQNVDQSGTLALSTITQTGSGNNAETFFSANQSQNDVTKIDQDGNKNEAYQLKDDEREGSLTIIQNNVGRGNVGNRAKQFTRKDQARALYIEQVGDNNNAEQDIYKGSNATTYQYGSNNNALVKSSGATNESGSGNEFTVNQGSLTGDSDNNSADIFSTGDANVVTVSQQGMGSNKLSVRVSDGATVDAVQNGFSNRVFSTNGVERANVLKGSDLILKQNGDNNFAGINMNSLNGQATVTQIGNNNVGGVTQN